MWIGGITVLLITNIYDRGKRLITYFNSINIVGIIYTTNVPGEDNKSAVFRVDVQEFGGLTSIA